MTQDQLDNFDMDVFDLVLKACKGPFAKFAENVEKSKQLTQSLKQALVKSVKAESLNSPDERLALEDLRVPHAAAATSRFDSLQDAVFRVPNDGDGSVRRVLEAANSVFLQIRLATANPTDTLSGLES